MAPHTAVDAVSFRAEPGSVTGFLGPNGAGKSTAMRIMVGLTPPTAGHVNILASDAAAPHPRPSRRRAPRASAQHAAGPAARSQPGRD